MSDESTPKDDELNNILFKLILATSNGEDTATVIKFREEAKTELLERERRITSEAVRKAEFDARDIERDVDYRYLPVGTKLKSKRTGNTVEIIGASYHYELKHHNDIVDTGDDYTYQDWEEVKGWFDVSYVPIRTALQEKGDL